MTDRQVRPVGRVNQQQTPDPTMINARNQYQLRRTLDALMKDDVIHGWGQDRLTSRYHIAVTKGDRRTYLSTADAWTLIGQLKPGR